MCSIGSSPIHSVVVYSLTELCRNQCIQRQTETTSDKTLDNLGECVQMAKTAEGTSVTLETT